MYKNTTYLGLLVKERNQIASTERETTELLQQRRERKMNNYSLKFALYSGKCSITFDEEGPITKMDANCYKGDENEGRKLERSYCGHVYLFTAKYSTGRKKIGFVRH